MRYTITSLIFQSDIHMSQSSAPTSGLTVQGLSHAIAGQSILTDFNFSLDSGNTCLILGASGSGKTTLLSLLSGLEKPDQGMVRYGDISLYDLSESQRDQFRGRHIGILFQTFHLIKPFTVQQNIALAGTMAGLALDNEYIGSLLKRLGLSDKINQKATTLSVGEAQRLALARALATKPKWLLCDEPTSSLDDANTKQMLSLLQSEAQTLGTSLVIVTHDSRVKEQLQADKTIKLEAVQ
jgi:putative ABC transport system ATP-binding protein